MTLDQDEAVAFAREWIDSWNSGELDRILSHYTEDFEMSSPLVREIMGVESGRLQGKEAVGSYWSIRLSAKPPVNFEFIEVLAGVGAIAIYYRNMTRRRRVIEHLRFNEAGLVSHAQALYSGPLQEL